MRQAFQFGCWKLASLNRGSAYLQRYSSLCFILYHTGGTWHPSLPWQARSMVRSIWAEWPEVGIKGPLLVSLPPGAQRGSWAAWATTASSFLQLAGYADWDPGRIWAGSAPTQQPTRGEGQRSGPSELFASSDERIWSGFNEATLIPHLFTHVSRPNVWLVLDVMLWFCFQ